MKAQHAKPGQAVRVLEQPPNFDYYAKANTVGVIGSLGVLHTPGKRFGLPLDVEVEVLVGEELLSVKQSVSLRDAVIGPCALVGADPEVMVIADGTVIPAWEFLFAKKEGAKPPQTFWDGFQAEFTIRPRTCHESIVEEIRDGLMSVLKAARGLNPLAQLSSNCVVEIPYEMMQAASDEHVALGCAPSLNVYDAEPLAVDGRLVPIRFAGCHIHEGIGLTNEEAAAPIVKAMDALVGVVSVAVLDGLEDPRRRQFYGKAGEYRLPPHGVEYRVPSSTVLANPTVAYLVFDLARAGAQIGLLDMRVWDVPDEHIRSIIDNCDVRAARKLLVENRAGLRAILARIYPEGGSRFAQRLIFHGANNCLEMHNMTQEWDLSESPRYRDWRVSVQQ